MSSNDTAPPWPPDRIGLTLLAVLSVVVALLLIGAYLQYILLAVVLAYVLAPAQRHLERYVNATVASATVILGSIVVVFIPVAYLLLVAIQQGLELLSTIQEGEFSIEVIEERIEATGYIVDLDALYTTYREPIEIALQHLGTGVFGFLSGLPGVLIGLTVTVFVLFVLLRDREAFLYWLQSALPVDDTVQQELFAELDDLMWASVVGNVGVAAIQAVVLGIGLALIGVPGVIFLTVTTFVFAMFPLIGAFGVWVPVSVYLLAIGRPTSAAILFVFGSVVSVSDLYLRPLIINRTDALDVATIVVGIFGGVVLFGGIGLFVGPVVLGGTRVVLDLYVRERAEPSGRPCMG